MNEPERTFEIGPNTVLRAYKRLDDQPEPLVYNGKTMTLHDPVVLYGDPQALTDFLNDPSPAGVVRDPVEAARLNRLIAEANPSLWRRICRLFGR